jgi:hypothetical protein
LIVYPDPAVEDSSVGVDIFDVAAEKRSERSFTLRPSM